MGRPCSIAMTFGGERAHVAAFRASASGLPGALVVRGRPFSLQLSNRNASQIAAMVNDFAGRFH